MLVEGEPDAGVAELLTLVGWPNRSADIHTPEYLVLTKQNLVFEADCYRWYIAEALQDDCMQALVVFGEEEIQVRSDMDDNWARRRVDIEFHVNLGELVLHPPQQFDDRP